MGEAEELRDRIGITLNGGIIEMDVAAGLKRRHQSNSHVSSVEEVVMAATESTFEEAEDCLPREEEKAGVTQWNSCPRRTELLVGTGLGRPSDG